MGLLFCIIFGVICAIVASNKGRSAVGWFFIGFFFTIIGLIVICVISNLTEERSYKFGVEQENRRLREQLRQEQIKAETFRTHTQRRLDAHDEKLAIDTRADDNVLTDTGALAALTHGGEPPFAQQVKPAAATTGWYYALDGQTLGPVSSSLIVLMIQNGKIFDDTLVWIEGMADWTPLARVPEFSSLVHP